MDSHSVLTLDSSRDKDNVLRESILIPWGVQSKHWIGVHRSQASIGTRIELTIKERHPRGSKVRNLSSEQWDLCYWLSLRDILTWSSECSRVDEPPSESTLSITGQPGVIYSASTLQLNTELAVWSENQSHTYIHETQQNYVCMCDLIPNSSY